MRVERLSVREEGRGGRIVSYSRFRSGSGFRIRIRGKYYESGSGKMIRILRIWLPNTGIQARIGGGEACVSHLNRLILSALLPIHCNAFYCNLNIVCCMDLKGTVWPQIYPAVKRIITILPPTIMS